MTTQACSLPPADRPSRQAEFDELFAHSVRRVEIDGTRARLHLIGDPGLRKQVLDLTARESRCCSFFTFAVDGDDGDILLDITVPDEHADLLAALAERAATISS